MSEEVEEKPPEPEQVPFIEEPEEFELRKYTKEKELDEDILQPKELYKIVKEKEVSVAKDGFAGPTKIYEFDKKEKSEPSPPKERETKTKEEEKPKKKEKKEKFKF